MGSCCAPPKPDTNETDRGLTKLNGGRLPHQKRGSFTRFRHTPAHVAIARAAAAGKDAPHAKGGCCAGSNPAPRNLTDIGSGSSAPATPKNPAIPQHQSQSRTTSPRRQSPARSGAPKSPEEVPPLPQIPSSPQPKGKRKVRGHRRGSGQLPCDGLTDPSASRSADGAFSSSRDDSAKDDLPDSSAEQVASPKVLPQGMDGFDIDSPMHRPPSSDDDPFQRDQPLDSSTEEQDEPGDGRLRQDRHVDGPGKGEMLPPRGPMQKPQNSFTRSRVTANVNAPQSLHPNPLQTPSMGWSWGPPNGHSHNTLSVLAEANSSTTLSLSAADGTGRSTSGATPLSVAETASYKSLQHVVRAGASGESSRETRISPGASRWSNSQSISDSSTPLPSSSAFPRAPNRSSGSGSGSGGSRHSYPTSEGGSLRSPNQGGTSSTHLGSVPQVLGAFSIPNFNINSVTTNSVESFRENESPPKLHGTISSNGAGSPVDHPAAALHSAFNPSPSNDSHNDNNNFNSAAGPSGESAPHLNRNTTDEEVGSKRWSSVSDELSLLQSGLHLYSNGSSQRRNTSLEAAAAVDPTQQPQGLGSSAESWSSNSSAHSHGARGLERSSSSVLFGNVVVAAPAPTQDAPEGIENPESNCGASRSRPSNTIALRNYA